MISNPEVNDIHERQDSNRTVSWVNIRTIVLMESDRILISWDENNWRQKVLEWVILLLFHLLVLGRKCVKTTKIYQLLLHYCYTRQVINLFSFLNTWFVLYFSLGWRIWIFIPSFLYPLRFRILRAPLE